MRTTQRTNLFLSTLLTLGLAAVSPLTAAAQTAWHSVGPDGGDARGLAADPTNPQHVYLGTTSSWVYQTENAGKSWTRLAKLGQKDDLIIDNIFVDSNDPKTVVVGAFEIDGTGGGIYISHNAGQSWTLVPGMAGQSVRSLAQAPSNPKLYIAGTLKGVFRSEDGGQTWAQISPAGSAELHEIESVAIDPLDTNTLYAGTWHLPWKSTDGGAHWSSMKNGLIDDSDVFSIIIDPKAPTVVYASACSGIYKSDSAGNLFHKVQGIPSTARRTRVLMQDPRNSSIVFAGTTEGLYRTTDAGTNWSRLTGPDVIVNDVYVDPTDDQRVMIATDRSGVLTSTDGGKTFSGANSGFSQRQVQSLLVDNKQQGTLYAGVLNDKIYGGVFVSHDSGSSWQQQAEGLKGRDVFALAQSLDGVIYAGTNDGVLKLSGETWQTDGDIVTRTSHTAVSRGRGKKKVSKTTETVHKGGAIEGRVNGLELSADAWFAATYKGVYRSEDKGATWELTTLPQGDYHYIDGMSNRVVAGTRSSLLSSTDTGKTWQAIALPSGLTGIHAVAVSADGAVWVAGREGVFFTKDNATWNQIKNLPLGEIDGLDFDPQMNRVIVSSKDATTIFGVDTSGTQWKYWQTGWRVHQVLQQGDHLVAASLFDGVVVEPSHGSGSR